MMNRGEVATMVLGSWAVSQMKAAGDNPDDVDYMPFPILVDGKQYSSASPDYSFGINASDDPDTIEAAMIFVKWMTEQSGFSVNEGGLPISASDDSVPDLYQTFQDQGVTFMFDELAVDGEEDLMNTLNEDSELAINNGGNDKVAAIVENASTQSESFDDIMNEWNEKWTDAQETEGVSIDQ
jgi:ABC-type glycerol-3-phosphate transport system substrate-binding protein